MVRLGIAVLTHGNELIEPIDDAGAAAGTIECRERPGGMLKYCHRRAA